MSIKSGNKTLRIKYLYVAFCVDIEWKLERKKDVKVYNAGCKGL